MWPMHFRHSEYSEYATENSLRLNMQWGAFRVFFLIPKSSETHFGDDVKYDGIQVQSKRSLTKKIEKKIYPKKQIVLNNET